MEAVRIKLLPKGSAAPGNTERYYTNKRLKLVAIDAGHQRYANLGQEPEGPGSTTMKTKTSGGATGTWTGTPEYQVTLDVSLMLQQELISRGYQTVMIRTSNDVDISNIERANIANNSQADAFVRIHCNSSENSSTSGALTICMSSANPYCAGLYSASRNLSQLVLNSLCARSGAKALGAGVFELYDMTGINWSKLPVTIVELGYLSNRQEEQKLIDKNYQAALAAGIADGIAAFLK